MIRAHDNSAPGGLTMADGALPVTGPSSCQRTQIRPIGQFLCWPARLLTISMMVALVRIFEARPLPSLFKRAYDHGKTLRLLTVVR